MKSNFLPKPSYEKNQVGAFCLLLGVRTQNKHIEPAMNSDPMTFQLARLIRILPKPCFWVFGTFLHQHLQWLKERRVILKLCPARKRLEAEESLEGPLPVGGRSQIHTEPLRHEGIVFDGLLCHAIILLFPSWKRHVCDFLHVGVRADSGWLTGNYFFLICRKKIVGWQEFVSMFLFIELGKKQR